jgi:hypothetical protein
VLPERSERGVALILTLIMLAIITIVTVVFLATTSRNRASTTVRIDQTTAEIAAETASQYAQAKIIERIIHERNLLAFDFSVSYPVSPVWVTNNGIIFHPPSYGFELNAQNAIVRPVDGDGIPRVVNNSNTVDVYLDLNRNRHFDDPGNSQRPFGDPIWMGILDRPWFGHSRSNRFVARYAYFVQPVGKSLDLNTIHNDTSPNPGYGYMRNQGFGPWELNLGAFLHELDPIVWDYDYHNRNVKPEARGNALLDALSIVRYREGWPRNAASVLDGMNFSQVYPDAALTNFPSGAFDLYADGNDGFLLGQNISLLDDDTLIKASAMNGLLPRFRWPGADTTNHFYHIQEFFDFAEFGPSNKVTEDFYYRVTNALTRQISPGVTNGSLFYRMLAQLGTQTGSDINKKINLNFADFHVGYSPTNFVAWDSSPALAVAFFTNVAERIFLAQSNEFNPSTNFVIRSMVEIPVYPTNRYSSGIHRILQLAANIYDAANTNLYPSVFRPLFGPGPVPGVNYIVGYVKDNDVNSLTAWLNSNTNGIPLVVGAKKGFPNFNEFTMWSEFLVERKLQLTRLATNLPPNSTNLMYALSISNNFGVELWNSYQAIYPRPVTITISNFTYGLLTNQFGLSYSNISSSAIASNVLVGEWPGRDNKFSFKVPKVLTNTFLSNAIYNFTANQFALVGPNSYERVPNFPVPNWYLTLSNRMTCLVSEGTNIVDFVLLNDSLFVDLTSALLSGVDQPQLNTPPSIRGVWSTNQPTGTGPTDGILKQIDISSGDPYSQVSQDDWKAFSTSAARNEDDKVLAILAFREFLKLPSNPGDPTLPANNSTNIQAGFTPAAKMTVISVWQANDPLVHYHVEDLRFEPPTTNYFRIRQPATNISPATLGYLNTRYAPWGGKPNTSATVADPFDYRIKDAGVTTSDDWHFPSNKLATIGLIGRVHRGTPWQTVYAKSFDHQPGEPNLATDPEYIFPWDPWMPGSKDTARVFEKGIPRIVSRTHPTNDWKLLDMFTTSLDERTSTGLVSVNQTNMETWSALLSGVLVLSNNLGQVQVGDTRTYEEHLIEPSDSLKTNRFMQIWTNIFRYQVTNGLPFVSGKPLEGIGELIQKVPELTSRSPFLNYDPADAAQKQLKFGLDDFAYEQIPQQILSLLRIGDSRFVIYAYGQALKPQHIDPSTGVADNYQVTAEFATRTVMRLEGDPRGRVRAVVESFNILPPD